MAKLFRDAGFTHACTTRASSHLLDSCGIDLNYVPVIVQIKSGTQRGLSIPAELEYIETQMQKLLPKEEPWHQKPKAVIHIKPASTNRRSKYDSLVTMTLADWMLLVQLAYISPQQLSEGTNLNLNPHEQPEPGGTTPEDSDDD